MIVDMKNKRICTLKSVLAILTLFFTALHPSVNQFVAQEMLGSEQGMVAEVLQVRWEADEDGLSATAIAEFDINSRWSGVEILDQNFIWEPFNLGENQQIDMEFAVERPQWRVVRGCTRIVVMPRCACRLLGLRME